MANLKYSQIEVTQALMEVFRQVGYEGASLEELAKATGLRKSSLYHRFPGGKKQMAEEVLKFAGQWVKENITNVLNRNNDPKKRLIAALKAVDQLYAGGQSACILRALSMDTGLDLFSTLISGAFEDLVTGFSKVGQDLGYAKSESKRLAEEAVIKIQGALILGRGTNNPLLFPRVLKEIRKTLTDNK